MVGLGILWNSVVDMKEQILNDVNEYCDIIDHFDLELGEDYEQFVRDIYSLDDIAEWKVDKKVETMFACSDVKNVVVVVFNIDTYTMEYHELKKRMVYPNLEEMKKNIRMKYKDLVPVYFFDNIFHVTDNEKEFEDDYNLVKSYAIKKNTNGFNKILKKEKDFYGFN